jgi:hypothetical protein
MNERRGSQGYRQSFLIQPKASTSSDKLSATLTKDETVYYKDPLAKGTKENKTATLTESE